MRNDDYENQAGLLLIQNECRMLGYFLGGSENVLGSLNRSLGVNIAWIGVDRRRSFTIDAQ
jgi:hypothetical protein